MFLLQEITYYKNHKNGEICVIYANENHFLSHLILNFFLFQFQVFPKDCAYDLDFDSRNN